MLKSRLKRFLSPGRRGWRDSNVPPMAKGCVAPVRTSLIEAVEREGEAEGDPQRARKGKKDGRVWDGGWKYLDIREGMNKTKLYPQCCLRGRRALNSLNKLAESSEIFPSRRSTECGENSSPTTDFTFFSFYQSNHPLPRPPIATNTATFRPPLYRLCIFEIRTWQGPLENFLEGPRATKCNRVKRQLLQYLYFPTRLPHVQSFPKSRENRKSFPRHTGQIENRR